jgi:hypothetical protein
MPRQRLRSIGIQTSHFPAKSITSVGRVQMSGHGFRILHGRGFRQPSQPDWGPERCSADHLGRLYGAMRSAAEFFPDALRKGSNDAGATPDLPLQALYWL